jgi:uncharacterized Zn-finger protein
MPLLSSSSILDPNQIKYPSRSHTGDCPYFCPSSGCDAAFKTLSDLRRHSRLHSGERPFLCPHSPCKYRAAVKSNLNSHVKRSHNSSAVTNPPCDANNPPSAVADQSSDVIIPVNTAPPKPPRSLLPPSVARSGGSAPIRSIGRPRLPRRIQQQQKSDSSTTLTRYFDCPFCTASFVREDSLRCHLRQHSHSDQDLSSHSHLQSQQREEVLHLPQPPPSVITQNPNRHLFLIPPDG